MPRPRISHAHRRWRALSHMFHGCRDVTKDSCEHVHAEVAAWSRPTSQGCTCNRQGEKEGSKVIPARADVAQPSVMLRDPSAASASCGARRQRGAFIVYLMFDVIKGQFGTMFGRTVGAFYRLIALQSVSPSLQFRRYGRANPSGGREEPERHGSLRFMTGSTAAAAFEHLASGTCCGAVGRGYFGPPGSALLDNPPGAPRIP